MFDFLPPWFIPVLVSFFILLIVIAIWSYYAWKKKVQSIKHEFNLIEGCYYDVLQNNGRTTKELKFVSIYCGNNSVNGNINLLFIKNSSYRGDTIAREVVIKYDSIWKVTKLN